MSEIRDWGDEPPGEGRDTDTTEGEEERRRRREDWYWRPDPETIALISGLGKEKGDVEIIGRSDVFDKLRPRVKKSPLFNVEKDLMPQAVEDAREKLRNGPSFFEMWNYREVAQEGFQLVPSILIVGGVSPSFIRWGSEYSLREGRHLSIVEGLVNAAKAYPEKFEVAVNDIYHVDDGREAARIQLLRVDGPAGPVYFVEDGTHRVSASKALELELVPAEVRKVATDEVYSEDPLDVSWWQELQQTGLLKGAIEQKQTSEGRRYFRLEVEGAVVPWFALRYRRFFSFNQEYDRLYPGAFQNLRSLKDGSPIPSEVFTDEAKLTEYYRVTTSGAERG